MELQKLQPWKGHLKAEDIEGTKFEVHLKNADSICRGSIDIATGEKFGRLESREYDLQSALDVFVQEE
jgi:hypothetical protein